MTCDVSPVAMFKSETIDIKIWTLHHSSFLKRLMGYGMEYTLGIGVTTAHKELILDMKCLEDIILSEHVIMWPKKLILNCCFAEMQLISLYQTTIESHYFHKLNKVINLQRLIFWSGFLFQLWRLRHGRKTCALVRPILHGLVSFNIYYSSIDLDLWIINSHFYLQICVRRERGYCKIAWRQTGSPSTDTFKAWALSSCLFVCLFVNLSYFDCLLFTIYWYFQGLSSFLIVLPLYWTHEVGQIANQLWQMSNSS